MKPYLLQVESVKQSLREDFLYLTEVLLKKTIPHANKQLQDTLTKYFLENYVSDLLKDKMRKNNNRAVFQEISSTISSGRPKYLKLLNAFEDKIRFYQLDTQYNNMLLILILDVGRHPRESEEWRTHTRKRMLSLLLYVHWNEQDKRDEFQSFFEMWKVAYPENPLPQRQFKNPKIHTFDQKNMYSSQSLEEDSLYNQKGNNNDDSNEEGQQHQPSKNKKLKTNKNEPQQQQQNTIQQISDIQKGIASGTNGISHGINFGNHFGFNQQHHGMQNNAQQANGLLLHQQAHPSSLLNQNIIKNHANQQNGFLFNTGNADFLSNLGGNSSQNSNINLHQQGNLFGQINKNEIGGAGGDHNSHQQQQQQALFNQQHKNYFNQGNNPLGNMGSRDFINLDSHNITNNQFKSHPIKQESTEDNANSTENQNQQQFLQDGNQQSLNVNAQNGENNYENSLNNTTNSMFFTNNSNIAASHNPLMALNGGQNYSNFFNGGATASYNYSSGLNNANFINYNGNPSSNPGGSNISNSIINMTSSYNQFNQQGNSINPKINESQNFLHLNPEKQLEKYVMDNSYNNEIFLTASHNLNLYQNPGQNLSHFNPISIAAAAAVMQNIPSRDRDANNQPINNANSNASNATNNNAGNSNMNNTNIGSLNTSNYSNNQQYHAQGKQTNNQNPTQNNAKKKSLEFNSMNNQTNQADANLIPVKLEQQPSFQQQQLQPQNKQQNLINSTQFLSSKILQSTNDPLQNFQKSRFNMGSSGTNFPNLQNNQSFLNANQLSCNLYNLGSDRPIIGFQNDIYGFFQQYYSEPKEEISWESTEPLNLYASSQAPLLSELNTIFFNKMNAIPTIQKAKETKTKTNIIQPPIISKEKDDEEISEVDSYEVDQNPVSQ